MTASPGPSALPRWCRVADAATVACVLTGLVLLVAGPYRSVWFGATVSVKWPAVLFVAVALAAVRHAALTSPTVLFSVRQWWSRVAERTALADALAAFWLTRPAVLLVGLLAVVSIGLPATATQAIAARDPLADLPVRFDSGWYAGIAADGYEWQYRFDRQQNIAFYPAFPLLMRAAGLATGAFEPGLSNDRRVRRLIWGGLLISLIGFLWALWYFSRLAHEILDVGHAWLAVLLLAAYPFALFYSAAYTESLFLLANVGAWYHFRRREWPIAATWALVAGLTRPNGFFLSVPLGLLALGAADARRKQDALAQRPSLLPALAVTAMPVAGMLLFTAYLYRRTGVWFAWSRVQGAWGRALGAGVPGISEASWDAGGSLATWVASNPYTALNAIGLLFALAFFWPVWRKVGIPWATFVAINVLLPLLMGGLLSMGRLTSTMFPLFLACAAQLSPRVGMACAVGFGLLQGLAAVLFFTWRPLF